METKAQVSEIKTIVTAGSLSIITKGAVKRSSLIDEKLGIYQRCTATGELEQEGKNENGQDKRPFYVFIQERSYVQESIGGSFKNIQAFNNFKSLQDAKDYVQNFAMCSKGCKIHTELQYAPFYAGQENVKFMGKSGLEDATTKEGAIYYRRFTFAADSYSPKTLEAQPVAEFVKVADPVAAF